MTPILLVNGAPVGPRKHTQVLWHSKIVSSIYSAWTSLINHCRNSYRSHVSALPVCNGSVWSDEELKGASQLFVQYGHIYIRVCVCVLCNKMIYTYNIYIYIYSQIDIHIYMVCME